MLKHSQRCFRHHIRNAVETEVTTVSLAISIGEIKLGSLCDEED
jgi:hypothetical protein